MRALLRFILLIAPCAPLWAQKIEGPTVARSGEQHIYRLSAPPPPGAYRWHLEWPDAAGRTQTWEGNENRPALNLTFPTQSGLHRLWLVTTTGTSVAVSITVAPNANDPRATTTVLPVTPPLLDLPIIASAELTSQSSPPSTSQRVLPTIPISDSDALLTNATSTPTSTPVQADAPEVIDLIALISPEPMSAAPNPFRVRYQPKIQVREVALNFGLLHIGPEPRQSSVAINGELYAVGDVIESLTITAIASESIELRSPQLVVRVPVRDRPVVLRVPR